MPATFKANGGIPTSKCLFDTWNKLQNLSAKLIGKLVRSIFLSYYFNFEIQGYLRLTRLFCYIDIIHYLEGLMD
jgi:hypothetical protein